MFIYTEHISWGLAFKESLAQKSFFTSSFLLFFIAPFFLIQVIVQNIIKIPLLHFYFKHSLKYLHWHFCSHSKNIDLTGMGPLSSFPRCPSLIPFFFLITVYFIQPYYHLNLPASFLPTIYFLLPSHAPVCNCCSLLFSFP